MLVLSRKKNEAIRIDDQIKIVVVEIRGDKVRLGIEAPANVAVHRQEVYEAIHRGVAKNNAEFDAAPIPVPAVAAPLGSFLSKAS